MNTEQFNQTVTERCEKIKNTLTKKAKEYSKNDDRLHNFNRAAQLSGNIREKALWGMMLKHEISMLDILDDIENGKLPSREYLDEKLGDFVNYLLLVEASIIDRLNEQDAEKQN